ncbi:MAG: DUF6261 family protein [Prevotellaceae bacterium]|jgi:hypothetical protein|nr:DUF6261 family protein [Prevotellaceae bacterium]
MNVKEIIQDLELSRLRQTEALGFFQRVSEPLKTCEAAQFKPFFQQFEADVAVFGRAVNPQVGSAETVLLTEFDNRRDNAIDGLFGQVKVMCIHFDVEIKEAARRLHAITENYADITLLPYIQENGKIVALLRDLDATQAKADLTKIGAAGWVTEIAAANEVFIARFDKRNEEETRITGLSLDCRRACENSYRSCVKMINALITVNGIEAYKTLADALNNLIDYQKQVFAIRDGRNKNDKETGK